MAKYTIELGDLVGRGYHLDLQRYPIFSEQHRTELNRKIIEHFWYREIGQETPDRFNVMLGRTMNEIMPYYNQLYMSELIKFDPIATDYFQENNAQDTTREYAGNIIDARKLFEGIGEVYSQTNKGSMENTGTNDIEETSTGQNNKTINVTGSKDTTRTDNLTETNTDQETTTLDTQQDVTSTSTTTNDLTTHNETESSGSGTNRTTGSKNTVFSDLPQSHLNITTTTSPNGTVTTTWDGYATTATNESTTQSDTTTTEETTTGDTTNTGTVKVDGNSNTANTGTTKVDSDRSKQNTGTVSTEETSSSESTEHGNENTTSTSRGNTSGTETTSGQQDSQRTTDRNERSDSVTAKNDKTLENFIQTVMSKGRKGFSPSLLLKQFRDTFLNIDMMVIDELEELFMGVF